MNKKGVQFKLAFFAVITLSMIIIATGIWIDEWNNDYLSGLGYDLNTYDELDSLSGEAGSQESNIITQTADQGSDFEATTYRGVFGIINRIYQPFRIVFGNGGMLDSVTERFGLPDYIRQGLVTMMVIAITFSLVAIIFKLPRTSA